MLWFLALHCITTPIRKPIWQCFDQSSASTCISSIFSMYNKPQKSCKYLRSLIKLVKWLICQRPLLNQTSLLRRGSIIMGCSLGKSAGQGECRRKRREIHQAARLLSPPSKFLRLNSLRSADSLHTETPYKPLLRREEPDYSGQMSESCLYKCLSATTPQN